MHSKISLLLIIVLFSMCKSNKSGTKDNEFQNIDNQNITLLLEDQYGGTEEPEFSIIREQGSLKGYFMKLNRTRKPGLPVPEIDFSKQIAIIYCDGTTNGPSTSSLYTMEENDEQIMLGVHIGEKAEANITAMTKPFHLYIMPITEKEIVLMNKK